MTPHYTTVIILKKVNETSKVSFGLSYLEPTSLQNTLDMYSIESGWLIRKGRWVGTKIFIT